MATLSYLPGAAPKKNYQVEYVIGFHLGLNLGKRRFEDLKSFKKASNNEAVLAYSLQNSLCMEFT